MSRKSDACGKEESGNGHRGGEEGCGSVDRLDRRRTSWAETSDVFLVRHRSHLYLLGRSIREGAGGSCREKGRGEGEGEGKGRGRDGR